MIDHVYLSVADPDLSLAFYLEALEPLGWREFGTGIPELLGITRGVGEAGQPISSSIWLRVRQAGEAGIHLGLRADDPESVDAAYAAALEAGAKDNGAPTMRTLVAEGYYAANVIDFDDNQLEFVHKH